MDPLASHFEYFRALRTEIIEAQKLRIHVGMTKAALLGTLLGFFFKDAKGDPAILVCPFIALMFDCMVYGLSHNIHDLGRYIASELEPPMRLREPWQRHRAKRTGADWGRITFRAGTYGLSAAVCVVSFARSMPAASVQAAAPEWIWRFALIGFLLAGWGLLIRVELFPKKQS